MMLGWNRSCSSSNKCSAVGHLDVDGLQGVGELGVRSSPEPGISVDCQGAVISGHSAKMTLYIGG